VEVASLADIGSGSYRIHFKAYLDDGDARSLLLGLRLLQRLDELAQYVLGLFARRDVVATGVVVHRWVLVQLEQSLAAVHGHNRVRLADHVHGREVHLLRARVLRVRAVARSHKDAELEGERCLRRARHWSESAANELKRIALASHGQERHVR